MNIYYSAILGKNLISKNLPFLSVFGFNQSVLEMYRDAFATSKRKSKQLFIQNIKNHFYPDVKSNYLGKIHTLFLGIVCLEGTKDAKKTKIIKKEENKQIGESLCKEF